VTTINEVLASLVACLCEQIAEAGLPDPCFCGLVPGEAAAADYIGDCNDRCGMAWVRLVSLYPSSIIGAADTTPGNCAKGLGADIEIGIMRCITAGESDGSPPSPAELLDATLLQVTDAIVMWKTVYCCDGIDNADFILGQYQPLGPGGGTVGGVWNLSVGL
jgi:hypothetical protein